jgi:hypothetical protein
VEPFKRVELDWPAIVSLAMLNLFPAMLAAPKMPFRHDTMSPSSVRA